MAYSISRTIAAATTNAVLVKPAPGNVNGFQIHNLAAYAIYVKLYNSATIPTAGAGTPVATLGVPAASAIVANFGDDENGSLGFNAGIGFTITKLPADNDTTVLVAADCILNLFYQ